MIIGAVPAIQRPAEIPLSFAQRRWWFLTRVGNSGLSYSLPITLRFRGALDRDALIRALHDVVKRHESLRTIFPETMGMPTQQILEPSKACMVVQQEVSSEFTLPSDLAARAGQEFDLTAEIPLRPFLFELGPSDHVLLLVAHHIAVDGWSIERVLIRDLAQAYSARRQGSEPQFSSLSFQYSDYTVWQLQMLGSQEDANSVMARQLAFWKSHLENLPSELRMPTDRQRLPSPTHHGDVVSLHLGSQVHADLLRRAKESQTTVFMLLQAALAALFTRLGAGTDIPIGSPIAGRNDSALNDLVGLVANTLVFRLDTSGNPCFDELLRRVRNTALRAYAHQELPFDVLVKALNPQRSPARTPLFQVMLAFQHSPKTVMDWPGLSVTFEMLTNRTAPFDLVFIFRERRGFAGLPKGIEGRIEYSVDLFDRITVQMMASRLMRFIQDEVVKAGHSLREIR